ncbi:MAG: mannose-1-phosphate guanylyltransferase/mannose-6-phosphate isomerase [Coriobacteriia bacterium]|nr:mannose-1-phosphate guanylyltransferase/mannose-6-phosphate isomerase [Coriobacteriia bacterium]
MTERIPNLHAVVLAGGSGTRFWPLSRELAPKQFVSIFGGVSLIAQAIERIRPLVEESGIVVLANDRIASEIKGHLASQPALAGVRIEHLCEPTPRNTAPAIALAAAYLVRVDPDALMIVLPSDHLLEDGDAWRRVVRVACAAARHGWLVTIGLEPTRPETGYGYIRTGEPLPGSGEEGVAAHRVERFVEKPDRAAAERYLAEGGFLWNSGMLIARADTVLAEIEAVGGQHLVAVAREIASLPPSDWTGERARARFAALAAEPFDTAVLERSARVAVVPARLGWSDVGSLLALELVAPPDERGNVLIGNVVDVDSAGSIVFSSERLIATLGLRDALVVDTADATLVAPKDRAQDVRLVVDALKARGAREVIEPRTCQRPWGSWTVLAKGPGFQVKTIQVLPGRRLSLQSHAHRSEHWVIVEGEASVERDGETLALAPGESTFIPAGMRHRLANAGQTPLQIVEVAVGSYLGEDDIVRYEDDWAR